LIALNKKKSCDEGTIVVTDFQTKGRGQRNNLWLSEKKSNLTFSFIISPNLFISYQFYLNIITSLSICNVLRSIVGENIKIKWPNDLFYKNSKIGGVLVENIIFNKKIQKSIIGIGININQKIFSMKSAISIYNVTSHNHDIDSILTLVKIEFEKNYNLLREKKFNILYTRYLSVLYNTKQKVNFIENDIRFAGIIIGIDNLGKIKIQVNGKTKLFNHGEIKFL